jgi:hypothetical protein
MPYLNWDILVVTFMQESSQNSSWNETATANGDHNIGLEIFVDSV